MTLVYHVTTHRGRPGVRLSKAGHWTNEPFKDDASAVRFATLDAAGRPFSIERKHVTKRLVEVKP